MNATITATTPAPTAGRPVRRTFPGEAVQVRRAREFVTRRAAARDCPDDVLADIALCVAELCNNAVRHSASGQPGGYFTVTVHAGGTAVRVEVADLGPDRASLPRGDAENGWGMRLVATHATQLGRVTWFERAWRESP